jgi:hypothetical protein
MFFSGQNLKIRNAGFQPAVFDRQNNLNESLCSLPQNKKTQNKPILVERGHPCPRCEVGSHTDTTLCQMRPGATTRRGLEARVPLQAEA